MLVNNKIISPTNIEKVGKTEMTDQFLQIDLLKKCKFNTMPQKKKKLTREYG
jgi:hypothetical protein